MAEKYVLVGGYMNSKWDDDWHYISAEKLLRLYGLKRSECVFTDADEYFQYGRHKHPKYKNLRPLFPDFDGDYNV